MELETAEIASILLEGAESVEIDVGGESPDTQGKFKLSSEAEVLPSIKSKLAGIIKGVD